MPSFSRLLSLAALVCAAVAVLTSPTAASALKDDPYTLSDGTVVDPTSSSAASTEERSSVETSIYTTLSHGGPMAGTGTRKLRQ
ncbi:hypothetical protein BBJ28_00015093 [Nothophytophthora sp. Chile5]|nr:hypothetical protein BBJ28_00015093 [Nothophytophthora sp. Chile5]